MGEKSYKKVYSLFNFTLLWIQWKLKEFTDAFLKGMDLVLGDVR